MRTLAVVILALALGLVAAATAPSADLASSTPAAGAAQTLPAKAVIQQTLRAQRGAARSRVTVRGTIQPPDASWSAKAEDDRILVTHTGACPADVRVGLGLLLVRELEPTGVRGRMVTTRFDTARARSVIVRFFDGSVQAEQIVGKRTGSNRIAGRLAAFGGTTFTPNATRTTGWKNSVELRVSGTFGDGCDDAGRAGVLADLDLMLGGNPKDQFPVTALYFRNRVP
jgi:hypothetical protein